MRNKEEKERHNISNGKWAKKNRDKMNRYHLNWRVKRYAWYNELKKGKKCNNCLENHPACLDFHHINPKEKIDQVYDLVKRGFNYKIIEKEIKKCVLLCSNCHRKLHWELKS